MKSFGYRGYQFLRNLALGKLESVLMRANHATTFSMERMDNQSSPFSLAYTYTDMVLHELPLFLIIAEICPDFVVLF